MRLNIYTNHLLDAYCTAKGWRHEVISDLGSGMNYRKKGLRRLIEMILRRQIRRLVLLHKDRLLRFGSEFVFSLCEIQGVEVVIVNQGSEPSFEEELAQDVLEVITVMSTRLYGARSHKNKKLMQQLQVSADAIAEEYGLYEVKRDDNQND